jgi:hypothetical protein
MQNKSALLLLAFFLTSLLLTSLARAQVRDAPKGWKRVSACDFSFVLPEDMQSTNAHGRDSCVEEFENKDVLVYLDYGLYSNPGGRDDSMKQYKKSRVRIGGRAADVITYIDDSGTRGKELESATLVHIVTRNNRPRVSLLLQIHTKESIDREIVKRIYQSIRYENR